ncbi:MAG TPA: XrtA/PEP-CTERM system histidine kinase PrsK [Stellaceae bacterium]|jgi:putative PEP-CTERM system histidine kinase|nr:XrtA/PEP-CTERM system histidine kinase PrsK [Stellaceae bacterium]
MTVAGAAALFCAVVYAGLLALTLTRRPWSRETALASLACALTAIWALAVFGGGAMLTAARPALEVASLDIWTIFLSLLVAPTVNAHFDPRLRLVLLAVPATVGCFVLWNDILTAATHGAGALTQAQIIGREAMAVFGLLLVENLYRNISVRRQWNVVPLCIALGGLFAYQLFLYSDALLFGWVSDLFAIAHPAVACLVAPFLALTLRRNRGWKVELHLSQSVVLHSLTLIASGVFLLAIVTVAGLLRDRGGDWGRVVQVTALFGSILVLVSIVSSGSVKARLKYLIARNFFSQRYDYRVEWMSFIDLLSTRDADEDLKHRVIEGIANVVDAQGGALWLRDGIDGDFVPVSVWNMRLPSDASEPADSVVVRGFRGGRWIQEFHRGRAYAALGECWLAVPLVAHGQLIGFITLARSRAPFELNWESFELLRALGRQAASYVAEERLGQQLQDSRRMQDYAQRFAFVAHDIKNLAAQLRMVTINAERHGDNPDFRADAFATIRHSVTRMNDLLAQLRANHIREPAGELVIATIDAVPALRRMLDERGAGLAHIQCAFEVKTASVRMAEVQLASAVKLLLDNAIEASPAGASILLGLKCRDGKLLIDVSDQGAGMDIDFIHGQLFRPFRSTKAEGYGIGAYQTRELLRMAGGDLDVISAPGAGTTMRIILPLAKEGAVSTAA